MECLEFVLCFVNPPDLDLYFILVQVGNQAFADYIDAHLDVTHINNKSASHIYLDLMNSNYSSDAL